MRHARALLDELRLWKTVWQQVETFLDQIDGAAQKDDTHRRRMEGLLRAARAVEHERARDDASRALGDPVITALPANVYVVSTGRTEEVENAWDDAVRRWRLPGADEVELAVGLLHVTDEGKIPDDETVALMRPVAVIQQVTPVGAIETLRLPSYPGPPGATIAESLLPGFGPSVKDSGGRISLFSREDRLKATRGESGDASPVRSWSTLCRVRRAADRTQTSDEDQVKLSTSGTGAPWGGPDTALLQVQTLALAVAATPAGAPVPAAAASQLHAAVTAARAAVGSDSEDLVAAAQMVEDDGVSDPVLADLIARAGSVAATRLTAMSTIGEAAEHLLSAPLAADPRVRLRDAANALQGQALPEELCREPVEGLVLPVGSPLAPELDRVIAARVEYPDGTLRALRTLENGFVATWPAYRRWFILRYRAVLSPALASFRGSFLAGLSALVRGGFTGLDTAGLTIGAAGVAVGADQVDLEQPAGLVPALASALEAGQLGMVGGDRPAPVVILGVAGRLGQASLHISPLRLSTASPADAPGPAGTLQAGTPIDRFVPRAATARELRRGRSDDGPGHDAPAREALALYGRLGLVFGSDEVERLLQNLPAQSALGARLIPAPTPEPPPLYGTVPGNSTTLIVHGLPRAFWARPGQDGVPADAATAEPRLARPGELLLLRGTVKGDGGDGVTVPPPVVVQAPIEVDDVYALAGDALARIDTSRAAVLSTSPDALPAEPPASGAALVCGPDDPLTVILLRRSWAREPLLSGVRLVRGFAGFDAASLAARTLLPLDLVGAMLEPGRSVPDVPGVGRAQEFTAALDTLDAWTRHAQ
ncbi:hypothetical protein [Micromonospora sp. CB01531]|uniref:hypothetical protein n=1 Tax=Micromonospora sp. CB01531 TaxID=1718947 RepID=UPI0009389617|nr:hypothetical protein [Micromonospora sp. CB01531]OKI51406.1 hypothetical protein A6A27_33570 [Micromonospora sp. CB01531]